MKTLSRIEYIQINYVHYVRHTIIEMFSRNRVEKLTFYGGNSRKIWPASKQFSNWVDSCLIWNGLVDWSPTKRDCFTQNTKQSESILGYIIHASISIGLNSIWITQEEWRWVSIGLTCDEILVCILKWYNTFISVIYQFISSVIFLVLSMWIF